MSKLSSLGIVREMRKCILEADMRKSFRGSKGNILSDDISKKWSFLREKVNFLIPKQFSGCRSSDCT